MVRTLGVTIRAVVVIVGTADGTAGPVIVAGPDMWVGMIVRGAIPEAAAFISTPPAATDLAVDADMSIPEA
jgi:hypothetical protein